MHYDRKIKYLDYFERGERIRGCGFVKLEIRDNSLRMELTVTGLHPTDTFTRDVILCGGDREGSAGRIEISGGRGRYQQIYRDLNNIGGTGISCETLQGLRISLGTNREISCTWQAAAQRTETANPGSVQRIEAANPEGNQRTAVQSVRRTDIESSQRAGIQSIKETNPENDRRIYEQRTKEMSMENSQQTGYGTGEINALDKQEPVHTASESETAVRDIQTASTCERKMQDGERKMPLNLQEDKWSQLWAIYPHIRPFRDEREYLSIRPADFVLFPAAAYKTINNSFLLHGYYNYNHLLLAKLERKGEVLYYIGVPGTFFEKEKQVAVMFGFESFECAEEPAQVGDFGYYMMRTEL